MVSTNCYRCGGGTLPPSTCGNKICDIGETSTNCLQDCPAPTTSSTSSSTPQPGVCSNDEECCVAGNEGKYVTCVKWPYNSCEVCDPNSIGGTFGCYKCPSTAYKCSEGTTRCNGNGVEICRDNNWISKSNCQYGCQNGECKPVPQPKVCSNDEECCTSGNEDKYVTCVTFPGNYCQVCDPNSIGGTFGCYKCPSTAYSISIDGSGLGNQYTASLNTQSNDQPSDVLWLAVGSALRGNIVVSDNPQEVTFTPQYQGSVTIITFIFEPSFKVVTNHFEVQ